MKRMICAWLVALGATTGAPAADEYPQAVISNRSIKATLPLPDAAKGYYRGTRFDWSGIITRLEAGGHTYFEPFYEKFDPNLRDVELKAVLSAGPISATSGPVEEFGGVNRTALGYNEAKPGGTFIKVGVGALRKPDEPRYDHFKMYEIADPGRWTVGRSPRAIEFTQELRDRESGYGYVYTKIVRLIDDEPKMVLEHTLRNVGAKTIDGNVYNHNFFVIDRQPVGPDFVLGFPFELKGTRDMGKLAQAAGREIRYLKVFTEGDVVQTPIQGFGTTAADYDIRVENRKTGAGVQVTGDAPLSRVLLWSPRTTLCPEAYIDYRIEPGREFRWKIEYRFYSLPASTN